MTIKLTANKKNKYVKFNHARYFAFTIGALPKNFAEVTSEEPITSWFNFNGLTFIHEAFLTNTYTLR